MHLIMANSQSEERLAPIIIAPNLYYVIQGLL